METRTTASLYRMSQRFVFGVAYLLWNQNLWRIWMKREQELPEEETEQGKSLSLTPMIFSDTSI